MNKKLLTYTLCFMVLNSTQMGFADNSELKKEKISSIETQDDSGGRAPLKGRAIMLDVNSDKLEYFQEKDQFVATGSAGVTIPEQNSKLEAQKITFDQVNQVVIAEGDVKITRDNRVIFGDYAKIDLAKESALITSPNTVINQIKITATTANVYPKSVEAFKGKANLNSKDFRLNLGTSHRIANSDVGKLDNDEEKLPDPNNRRNYKLVTKEVVVNNYPDHNVVILKNTSVWLGKFKIATVPYMELNTNKKNNRMETMLPEIGYDNQIGMYAGPSHVFYLPKGSTLKVSPIAAFGSSDSVFGGGGIARFTTDTNRTMVGYATLKDKIVVEGEQQLFTPNTKLVYGSNSYISDGFLGNRRAKYLAEIVDERKLASAFNFDFYSRLSGGYAEDFSSNLGTARFKVQGKLINSKPLIAIHDDLLRLRLVSQFDMSVYGTGDTFGVVRAGPRIDSRLGRLSLRAAYYQAAVHGESPLRFDRYMYGKSNLCLGGDLKVTKSLSIGTYRSINLLKDFGSSDTNHKSTVENMLYATIGPGDLKFRIGYDFERKRSAVGLDMMVGSGQSAFDFDKLKVNEIK